MTITRTQAIPLGIAAVLILIVGIAAGRGCAPSPPATTAPVTGIDAGPGEQVIDQQLDASLRIGEEQMQSIEHKFDSDLAAFDEQQRAEYDRLRGGDDLDAAAQMLSQWNHERRARKEDAGT